MSEQQDSGCPRRIAPKYVRVLSICIVTMTAYIASWGLVNWMWGCGLMGDDTWFAIGDSVYWPIEAYVDLGLPGHQLLLNFELWSIEHGLHE